MSNPTELPDLERQLFEAEAAKHRINIERSKPFPDRYKYEHAAFMWDFWQSARRDQPECEAPQAERTAREAAQRDRLASRFSGRATTPATADFDLPAPNDAARPECQAEPGSWSECQMRTIELYTTLQGPKVAASLSPLCGAQHAESGKEVEAKPPFPISDDEMAALRRFWECATDGEGYDVEKSMMQRLAEMGLVQRKSGAYYMATDFGLYVLGEYTIQRAAQLDGGQEGSAT